MVKEGYDLSDDMDVCELSERLVRYIFRYGVVRVTVEYASKGASQ